MNAGFSALSPQESHERISMIRLARTPKIGPITFSRFLGVYGTATRTLDALIRDRHGSFANLAVPPQAEIEDEIAFLEKLKGRHVLRSDKDYPLLLTHIPDAPTLLFVRGDIQKTSLTSLSIVGARNASIGGIRLAESLAAEAANAGICIISGLARGIDSAAHKGALHSGLTVAALAGGLDVCYPPENARLQEAIAERGCLVTEQPPGIAPQAYHYARRNRIIAGMSLGCLVIEAAQGSGTMITAKNAVAYNRAVLAAPGSPLDARSRGSNDLIRQGAILTETMQDILLALPEVLPQRVPAPWTRDTIGNGNFLSTPGPLDPDQTLKKAVHHPHGASKTKSATTDLSFLDEKDDFSEDSKEDIRKKMLSLLSFTPIAVDDIIAHCQFSISMVMTIISELELEGVIECLPGGQVALLPDKVN
ncbi:DNA-protecting protein DprA [Aristophania vespae]|uniref:DNA-protecting protein DprA n=1 Tax=Aristophania vespae TaxID=2697033 RepID=A0A6P1N9C8_9PROT|nr:DNA-processing protein DprA [Aristophania vespae]QHI95155.1 DNA-protecting protein DprA [Aristophania vespae]